MTVIRELPSIRIHGPHMILVMVSLACLRESQLERCFQHAHGFRNSEWGSLQNVQPCETLTICVEEIDIRPLALEVDSYLHVGYFPVLNEHASARLQCWSSKGNTRQDGVVRVVVRRSVAGET